MANIIDWLCPYCRELNTLESPACKCGKPKAVVSHALPYLDFLAADLAPRNKHHTGRRNPRQMNTKESMFYSGHIRPYLMPVGQQLLWCMRFVTFCLPNGDRFELDFIVADTSGQLHSFVVWGAHSQFNDEKSLAKREKRELPIIEHAAMAYPHLNIEVVQFAGHGQFKKVFPK